MASGLLIKSRGLQMRQNSAASVRAIFEMYKTMGSFSDPQVRRIPSVFFIFFHLNSDVLFCFQIYVLFTKSV